jgi:penicillin G amidase
MRRWVIRAGAGALFLAVAVTLALWLTLRASLPQLDGSLSAAGLGGTAIIERDSAGIPTITAENRVDLAYATGFAHGQDRFFQMDLIRRRAAGELSELFGELAIDFDRRNRFHRFRHRADAVLAASPPADLEILESYAAGVNAGLGSLGAKPFEYLLLGV